MKQDRVALAGLKREQQVIKKLTTAKGFAESGNGEHFF
jgi:hypothetical protein